MNDLAVPAQYDDIAGVLPPALNIALYGQDLAINFINKLLTERRLHHALLFTGPKGVGKATCAFQLAWNILSGNLSQLIKPDPASGLWRQMAQESHPSFLHVSRSREPNSDKFRTAITVDDIRNANQMLTQTAANDCWRVVIIDSADDLNHNAANALLKTLEEPPARVLFILISHHTRRLLPTIHSRCMPIHFNSLNRETLKDALSNVIVNKKILTDSAVIDKALSNADGRVRNAALLLVYGGLEISQALSEILSVQNLDYDKLYKLGSALAPRDAIIQYQQFCDDLLTRIAEFANRHARAGNVTKGAEWAQLWTSIQSEQSEVDTYNLDKKQHIILSVERFHQSIHNN